jgi:hypothetical protein
MNAPIPTAFLAFVPATSKLPPVSRSTCKGTLTALCQGKPEAEGSEEGRGGRECVSFAGASCADNVGDDDDDDTLGGPWLDWLARSDWSSRSGDEGGGGGAGGASHVRVCDGSVSAGLQMRMIAQRIALNAMLGYLKIKRAVCARAYVSARGGQGRNGICMQPLSDFLE